MSREVILPSLQLCAAANRESRMIQSRPPLGEFFPLVGVVAVEDDRQRPLLVCQHHSGPTFVRRLQKQRQAEDVLVPNHAGIEVGHCDRQVVQDWVR